MAEFSKEPVWRRRAEGRSAREHEVRRGHSRRARDRPAYTRDEAKKLFLKAATATSKPFIYLSAGVSNAEFTETLALAAESGVKYSGVLCGRATWKDGIPVYAKQGAGCVPEVARVRPGSRTSRT